MTDFTVKLHPDLVNMTTEGSMDTSIKEGQSIQRTVHGIMIKNGTNRKMVGKLVDGETFNDSVEKIKNYAQVNKGLADVYILTDNVYVDWVEAPSNNSHEANNLIALFEEMNISYEMLTDIEESTFAGVPSSKKLIIPELEEADLLPDLTNSAKTVIENFVSDGGTLVMFNPGSGDPLDVLNNVFGFSLSGNGFSTPISLTIAGASLFPTENATIPDLSGTDAIDTSTLPEGSVSIYEGSGTNESLVVKIPYGSGQIYVLGWDWFDAVPIGAEDGGWIHLLLSILES